MTAMKKTYARYAGILTMSPVVLVLAGCGGNLESKIFTPKHSDGSPVVGNDGKPVKLLTNGVEEKGIFGTNSIGKVDSAELAKVTGEPVIDYQYQGEKTAPGQVALDNTENVANTAANAGNVWAYVKSIFLGNKTSSATNSATSNPTADANATAAPAATAAAAASATANAQSLMKGAMQDYRRQTTPARPSKTSDCSCEDKPAWQ